MSRQPPMRQDFQKTMERSKNPEGIAGHHAQQIKPPRAPKHGRRPLPASFYIRVLIACNEFEPKALRRILKRKMAEYFSCAIDNHFRTLYTQLALKLISPELRVEVCWISRYMAIFFGGWIQFRQLFEAKSIPVPTNLVGGPLNLRLCGHHFLIGAKRRSKSKVHKV